MDFEQSRPTSWLERPLTSYFSKLNVESLLVVLILVAGILTRLVGLGNRVMSHDEVNHVVPAYSLYTGNGYAYDPVTHGPLQFHMMALSYFLLGDSDFSSRAPDALVSVVTIGVVLFIFRRYLGRKGALIAGFLFLISPYMMFYGRYTRNEVYGGLWTVLLLYGTLRYLEKGDKFSLYLMTVVMALHATDKATSFIYTAQLLLFLTVLFVERVTSRRWIQDSKRWRFLILIAAAIIILLVALGYGVVTAGASPVPSTEATAAPSPGSMSIVEIGLLGVAGLCVVAALVTLVMGLGWKTIRSQRTFDLVILAFTLIMPQLAAFPTRMLGWDPLDYSATGMTHTALFLVPLAILALAIGMWWKPRFWLRAAAIYYVIFTVLYTTFFTNGKGFFMGLVAALGYWLSQQGVQRGSQPIYYYALVQVPIYEYLAALGTILALVIAWKKNLFSQFGGFAPAAQPETPPPAEPVNVEEKDDLRTFFGSLFGRRLEPQAELAGGFSLETSGFAPLETVIAKPELEEETEEEQPAGEEVQPPEEPETQPLLAEPEIATAPKVPVIALLIYWSLTSLVAYSLAGEKMPWLTVHIAGAMLLAAGWALGYVIDTTPWKKIAGRDGLIAVLLLPVVISSLAAVLGSLLGDKAPFQGNEVSQLEATSTFTISLILFAASFAGLMYLLRQWEFRNLLRLLGLAFFGFLAVLTARTAYTASFINYDYATEFLVYAHGGPGPKQMMAQIEEISRRITRGKDIVIAYDNDTNYPFWWYLRDYPNKRFYADKPTRDQLDAPLVAVGDVNYSKVEPLLKDNYVSFEYTRLWWPMQDYWNLTPERIWNAISNPTMRQALFDIWLNRDYSLYAQVTGSKSLTLESWSPAAREKLYIRKDILAEMWNYGTAPATTSTVTTDPYAAGILKVAPATIIGAPGSGAAQFAAPRGLDVAPDGTIYVADSRNNRIQHLSADGKLINQWGTFADVLKGPAPEGTLNEPWDVKVGPDGNVYVADTFNFRIQKFTADGKFLKMWGYFGQGEKPEAFWGPRGLAFDAAGRLYVTDTGNKRVVIFTPDGVGVTSFGTAGYEQGQLDEPVGIAIDKQGDVWVADTWNQRIQAFAPDASGTTFLPMRMWDVQAWFGQSLDNKPYLAVDASGNVYITDPEGVRVLVFNSEGKFLYGLGDTGDPATAFVLPSGIAVDKDGNIWVTDGSGSRVMRYAPPKLPAQPVQVSPTSAGSSGPGQ